MTPIELPILFKSAEECKAEERAIQLNMPMSEYEEEIRPLTFYAINGISPCHYEGKKWYTSVHSNGTEYICPSPYKLLKYILSGENLFNSNDARFELKRLETLIKQSEYKAAA